MIAIAGAAAAVAAILYFSLRSSPYLGDVTWLPVGLARWADSRQGEDIRTAVPFVLLGVCAGWAGRKWHAKVRFVTFLLMLPLGVEVAQLMIPSRTGSMKDVVWGWAGGIAGLLIAGAFRAVIGWLRTVASRWIHRGGDSREG